MLCQGDTLCLPQLCACHPKERLEGAMLCMFAALGPKFGASPLQVCGVCVSVAIFNWWPKSAQLFARSEGRKGKS
eukprot:3368471-Amphidinium_carterae.1